VSGEVKKKGLTPVGEEAQCQATGYRNNWNLRTPTGLKRKVKREGMLNPTRTNEEKEPRPLEEKKKMTEPIMLSSQTTKGDRMREDPNGEGMHQGETIS